MATDPAQPDDRTLRDRIKAMLPEPVLAGLRRLKFGLQSNRRTFSKFYSTNYWGEPESVSGAGSRVDVTEAIRGQIPQLIDELGVKTFLDAPCGDFNWMRLVDFGACRYIGADVVPVLIERNQREFATATREFRFVDICKSPLPEAQMMLCRDCLVHLGNSRIRQFIANLKRSSIAWILTTTYPEVGANHDVVTGKHRPLNLTLPPFSWPQPERLIREGAEGCKSLGLWRVEQVPEMRP